MEEIKINPQKMFVAGNYKHWTEYKPMIVVGKFNGYYVATDLNPKPLGSLRSMTFTFFNNAVAAFDYPIKVNNKKWLFKGYFIIVNNDKRLSNFTLRKDNSKKDIAFETDSWEKALDHCAIIPYREAIHDPQDYVK